MKKVYLAPQTEAIQLLGENAIMAVSPGDGFTLQYGEGDGGGGHQRGSPQRRVGEERVEQIHRDEEAASRKGAYPLLQRYRRL